MIGRRKVLGGLAVAGFPGGNPPMRADQAVNLARTRAGSGPAPQNTVFIGRLVVIFGTGPTSGLFVYSGSPKGPPSGNLIYSITQASTDPYGNTTLQGATSYGASGVTNVNAGVTLVYGSPPGLGTLLSSDAPASGVDSFGNAYLAGLATYGASGTTELNGNTLSLRALTGTTPGTLLESAPGRLVAQSGLGTGANQAQLFLFDNNASPFAVPAVQAAGGSNVFDVQGSTFLEHQTVVGSTIAATVADLELTHGMMAFGEHTAPGTPPAGFGFLYMDLSGNLHFKDVGGVDSQLTQTSPAWSTLGTLANFAVTEGRFRVLPDRNEVEVDVKVVSSGANASATTFSVTLPAAAQPVTTHDSLAMGTTRPITAGDISPRLQVTAAGAVIVTVTAAVSATFAICVKIPLD